MSIIKNTENNITGTEIKKVPFGDLKVQHTLIKEEIDEAIHRVIERGWFILGEEVESFEKEFAEYCGCTYGIGVGSGTEAIHLSLLALSVKPGDEVITVPNTAVPTISAVSFAGAVPRFVDVNPETYTIDVAKIGALITKKTKAIIPVHLYGQCADMDPILDIAKQYNLAIIEDACQAHGSLYKGRKSGSLGDVGCFSFYPSKNLGALGDGGIVITNDAKIAERLYLLRNYGQERRYYHKIKGFNSRLDEIQAAILRLKLKHLDVWNTIRREKARLYISLLKDTSSVITPNEAHYSKHVYHLFVIRCKQRDTLREFLLKYGVGTLIHYPIPVHLQDSYKDLGYRRGDFPITENYAEAILSLPMYPEINDSEIEYIAVKIREFFNL